MFREKLQVEEETNQIVLNAVDLTIECAVVVVDNDKVEAKNISFCPEQETVTFEFPNVLQKGTEGVLHVVFKGNLNDKMKGFYRSKYYTPSGDERYAGVTQLWVNISYFINSNM